MLYTNDGRVHIEGDVPSILADLAIAIKSVKECLEERDYDDDFIRENIAECGRLAFMTKEERNSRFLEKVSRLAEGLGVDESVIESIVKSAMDDEDNTREG